MQDKDLFDELGFEVVAHNGVSIYFRELDADTAYKAGELCENVLPPRIRKQYGLNGVHMQP